MSNEKILNALSGEIEHKETVISEIESKINLLIGSIWDKLDPSKIKYCSGVGFDYYTLTSLSYFNIPDMLEEVGKKNIYLIRDINRNFFGISFSSDSYFTDYFVLFNLFKRGLMEKIYSHTLENKELRLQDIAKHIYENIVVNYGHLFLFYSSGDIKNYSFGSVYLIVRGSSYELKNTHPEFNLVDNIDCILDRVYSFVEEKVLSLSSKNNLLDEFSLLLDVELSD